MGGTPFFDVFVLLTLFLQNNSYFRAETFKSLYLFDVLCGQRFRFSYKFNINKLRKILIFEDTFHKEFPPSWIFFHGSTIFVLKLCHLNTLHHLEIDYSKIKFNVYANYFTENGNSTLYNRILKSYTVIIDNYHNLYLVEQTYNFALKN